MANTKDHLFASVVPDANAWLDEICDELGWTERRDALHALRAALHVIRDRLSPSRVRPRSRSHARGSLPATLETPARRQARHPRR